MRCFSHGPEIFMVELDQGGIATGWTIGNHPAACNGFSGPGKSENLIRTQSFFPCGGKGCCRDGCSKPLFLQAGQSAQLGSMRKMSPDRSPFDFQNRAGLIFKHQVSDPDPSDLPVKGGLETDSIPCDIFPANRIWFFHRISMIKGYRGINVSQSTGDRPRGSGRAGYSSSGSGCFFSKHRRSSSIRLQLVSFTTLPLFSSSSLVL